MAGGHPTPLSATLQTTSRAALAPHRRLADRCRRMAGPCTASATPPSSAEVVLEVPDIDGASDAFAALVDAARSVDPSLPPLPAGAASQCGPSPAAFTLPPGLTKPPWLRQRAPQGERYEYLRANLRDLKLATVCEEAVCPNIGECWNGGGGGGDGEAGHEIGTATIMLLGDTCTRGCRFCAVNTASTPAPPDENEPEHTAAAIAAWGVGYVVLTSVDRDDLPDGGSAHYARTVRAVKARAPHILVECLVGDFAGDLAAVDLLANSGLDVFAHNLETVASLQRRVRDARAGYDQSLAVLRAAKSAKPGLFTKSSLMLGFGETDDEVIDAMCDLRDAGVDILTFGQYLQPTPRHLPVVEFVHPDKFEHWRRFGEEECGFRYVASGPLVRSSYRAGEFFVEAMIREERKA